MLNFLFKNNLSYDIAEQTKIVYLKFIGEVPLGCIVKVINKVIEDDRFNWSYNWVVDIRRSKQLFAHNKLDLLVKLFIKNSDLIHNVKMAIIVHSPKQYMTVDSFISILEINNVKIMIKRVLDMKIASSWVL